MPVAPAPALCEGCVANAELTSMSWFVSSAMLAAASLLPEGAPWPNLKRLAGVGRGTEDSVATRCNSCQKQSSPLKLSACRSYSRDNPAAASTAVRCSSSQKLPSPSSGNCKSCRRGGVAYVGAGGATPRPPGDPEFRSYSRDNLAAASPAVRCSSSQKLPSPSSGNCMSCVCVRHDQATRVVQ